MWGWMFLLVFRTFQTLCLEERNKFSKEGGKNLNFSSQDAYNNIEAIGCLKKSSEVSEGRRRIDYLGAS